MRPLRLTLEGFRSYVSATTFDFSDRRLVGIVGPIGSGKSTILDAVSFALYGKTHTQAAATRTLINQRSDTGKVELVFEANGDIWRVVRVLRGQSEHAAYRYATLEDLDAEAKPIERVLKKNEVDARLVEVLGLDFAAFGRSVMLAQNRFAEFLSATPADRDVVLKGVFGFDRIDAMHNEARRRRDELSKELEDIDRRQKDLDNEQALLAAATEQYELAKTRHDELAAIGERLAVNVKQLTDKAAARDEAKRRIASYDELALRLPAPEATAKLLEAATQTKTSAAMSASAVAEAEESERRARQAHVEALAAIGGVEMLTQARATATAAAQHQDALVRQQAAIEVLVRERSRAVEGHEGATAAANKAAAELGKSTELLAARQQVLQEAEAQLRAADRADMAGALRTTITAGDLCPVCQQEVVAVPEGEAADGSEARRAYEQAHAALDDARAAHGKLEVSVAKAEAAVSGSAQALERAETRLADARAVETELREALTASEDLLRAQLGGADLDVTEHQISSLARAAQAAADAAGRARDSHAELVRSQKSTDVQLEQLVGQLHALSGALGLDTEIGSEPDLISVGLETVRSTWLQQREQASSDLARSLEELERVEAERQDLLDAVGLPIDADYSQAVSDARAAVAARQTEVETRTERLVGADELVASAKQKLIERDTYATLASDLTPSNFLRFLLEEERRTLSQLGSERFEELTGGRYRFSEDGKFHIVDLAAAEQARKAETLSGGETFLASLALALALAEMVGRGGGRLDAFFLDEGFGSLDSEHLDLAMAGIERLVADHDNRLVVVVSHVPDMRERMEDLIELDKDPATGATVVRRA